MVAGLASTILVPASSLLIIHLGGRHALIVLAIAEGATIVPTSCSCAYRVRSPCSDRDGDGVHARRQAAGVVALLLVRNTAGVVLFVLLFGLGFGVLHIARPDLLAQYVPRPLFGRLSGVQALLVIIGEATAPTTAAALHTITGSYTPMFIAVGACSLTAALLFAAADRAHRKGTGPPRLGSSRQARCEPFDAVAQLSQHRVEAAGVAGRDRVRDGPADPWPLAQLLVCQVA